MTTISDGAHAQDSTTMAASYEEGHSHALESRAPRWPEVARPQDLVITLLGSYVRGRLERVWSGGLVNALGEFGFSTGASRVALARLARHDFIRREKTGRKVAYVITDRAESVMEQGDSRIFATSPTWDKRTLTVLWHTIPEGRRTERGRMARRLRFLGFGSPQDATWIGLGDREQEVLRILEELEVLEYSALVVGRVSDRLGLDAHLDRAWDIPALVDRYRRFSDYFGQIDRATLSDAEAFRVRTELIHSYRVFPSLDPGLPDELLEESVWRQRAVAAFESLYQPLEVPSWRYFDRLVQADGPA